MKAFSASLANSVVAAAVSGGRFSGSAAGDSGSYNVGKEAALFQNREIENQVADGDAGARRAVARSENPDRADFESGNPNRVGR